MPLAPRLFTTCIAAIATSVAAHAETLRLRADNWMPYNGAVGDANPGYAIEVAKAVLEPHGITVDYQNLPWGDALKAAAAGQIDAVVGANKGEAAGLVLSEQDIGVPRVALIVRKDSGWKYQNIGSLRAIHLGVIADYKYWPTFDDYIAKHAAPEVVVLSGEHPLLDGIAMLKDGRLDVLAETATVFAWTAKHAGHAAADFRIVYVHEGESVFFAFAPGANGERYAKLLDAGLRELRSSGRLAAILGHYGLTDWKDAR